MNPVCPPSPSDRRTLVGSPGSRLTGGRHDNRLDPICLDHWIHRLKRWWQGPSDFSPGGGKVTALPFGSWRGALLGFSCSPSGLPPKGRLTGEDRAIRAVSSNVPVGATDCETT